MAKFTIKATVQFEFEVFADSEEAAWEAAGLVWRDKLAAIADPEPYFLADTEWVRCDNCDELSDPDLGADLPSGDWFCEDCSDDIPGEPDPDDYYDRMRMGE